MGEEIDLIDVIKFFGRKKLWIIVVGIICVILAVVYTKFLVIPEYTSVASFILTKDDLKTEADVYSYAKLPDRYFAIVNSVEVLNKVIANLKLDKFESVDDILKFKEEKIEITSFPPNFLITVSVTTDNAKEAADIANEIVKVSIEEIKNTYNDEKIEILDVAVENWKPVNVELISNVVKFVLVGEIFICGYLLIRYMFVEGQKRKEDAVK